MLQLAFRVDTSYSPLIIYKLTKTVRICPIIIRYPYYSYRIKKTKRIFLYSTTENPQSLSRFVYEL